MLRLAFDFIITWRETRTRPNAYDMFRSVHRAGDTFFSRSDTVCGGPCGRHDRSRGRKCRCSHDFEGLRVIRICLPEAGQELFL